MHTPIEVHVRVRVQYAKLRCMEEISQAKYRQSIISPVKYRIHK